ncbi:MAG: histidine phosphatase family protein [Odoribacteraceae bacterium]|jgi:probable phosphoglycerate mutase|nr:histidine phosphatase family protein [Odoribacteraceae bacterium]
MSQTIIIARHGNTFLPGETPRRVGGATDLPLVEEKRARAAGKYLLTNGLRPDRVYAAPLKRTTRTAELIVEEARWNLPVLAEPRFTEVDYGPDENQTEEQVKRRLGEEYARANALPLPDDAGVLALGEKYLDAWNARAVVPPGWRVDVEAITRSWRAFAAEIPDGERVLLCTSNGIIRFAPCLLEGERDLFCRKHDLKVATGSLSIFQRDDDRWRCVAWNIKPFTHHA